MRERHRPLEEPTICKLVGLVDVAGEAVQLVVVEIAAGTKYLVVTQVLHLLVKQIFTMKTLHRAIQQAAGRRDPFSQAGIMLKSKLRELGASKSKSPCQLLATLASIHKALRQKRLPAALLSSLASLHGGVGNVLREEATRLRTQNAPASTSPPTLHFAEHLPHSVDTAQVPVLRKRQKYSLDVIKPSLARSSVLTLQFRELRSHAQVALVMDREPGPILSETWDDIRKQCMLFLGFVHLHFQVAQPNLTHFMRADWLAAYCGSKGARGDRGISICKAISAARRVVLFYRHKCVAEADRLTDLHTWLGALSSQVRRAWPSPKRNVIDMKQAGTWSDAAAIVAVLVQHKVQIEADLSQLESLNLVQARRLHDVTLACCMFGWLPPPRSSTVRTLCSTRHRGPCPHIDCKSDSCWGNRIYVGQATLLTMEVPHHKSEKTWGALRFVLPADLSALIIMYMNKAYPVLRRELDVDHPFAFMSMSGAAFASGTYSTYFKKTMVSLGGPAVAPHSLRHIFVIDQLDHSHHRGTAYVMGHDLDQWDRSYDLQSLQRRGQHAIDGMQAWRAGLLARVGVEAPAPSTPPVLVSVASSDSPSQASWHTCSSTSVSTPSSLDRRSSSSSDESSVNDEDFEIDIE